MDKDRTLQYPKDDKSSIAAGFPGTSSGNALLNDPSAQISVDQTPVRGKNRVAKIRVGDFGLPCKSGERLVLKDTHSLRLLHPCVKV
jgi:hypothetical protein